MSNVQNLMTFHYTDCFIGILIMAYYNPYRTGQYRTGQYNSLYTANNEFFLVTAHVATSLRHLSDQWGWKRRRMNGTLLASPRKAPMLASSGPVAHQKPPAIQRWNERKHATQTRPNKQEKGRMFFSGKWRSSSVRSAHERSVKPRVDFLPCPVS